MAVATSAMTLSEWDNTPWSGTQVAPQDRSLVVRAPMGMATVVGKAATGAGVSVYETGVPLSVFSRSPRRMMRDAQAAYRNHTWIRVAERAVTRKVAGLPWHLEDAQDEEIGDDSDPISKAVLDLLQQPQAKLPPQQRQPGINSWRGLVSITSRHMGLCNLGHWYLDAPDEFGIPRAILYINPARMEPVPDSRGHLTGWLLDADLDGRNGTPLGLEELLTFYLDPPDQGFQGSGLYEAVLLKARVTTVADQHATYVLGTGGRIPGIIAPKEGYIDNDDTFQALVREFRNVNEAVDAAKRTTILRGPVDYTKTGGDAQELSLVDLSKMNREDILSTWGVPVSQAPISLPAGLNSGETKGYDEAILMQGAVHDRVVAISETIQYGLLDRAKAAGRSLELEIEEPEFDDETPAYDRAFKATNLPLTHNDRRAIIGLDPLPDFDPVSGDPLGVAIYLPGLLTLAGVGPSDEKRPAPVSAPVDTVALQTIAGKAAIPPRDRLLSRFEPQVRKAVASFLSTQREAIAEAIRSKGAHLAAKPKDRAWWDQAKWDKALLTTLRGLAAGLAGSTATVIEDRLAAPGKAEFDEAVIEAVLKSVGLRVKDINQTTRDAIAAAVEQGFADGLSPAQVAASLEGLPAFDAARAELVARTETALVYNEAALTSYRALDVTQVQAIDGDQDEVCAARDGQVFPIEEAMDIQDHPNGTLDWLPVLGGAS